MDEKTLTAVLADAGVQAGYLFGSRAEGSAHAASDTDIGILAARPLGLLEEQGLAARLEQELGTTVDVVVLNTASLELRGHVVQTGRLLYDGDPAARVAFEVRTRSEFFDYEPTLRAHTRRYLRQVAEAGL